MRPKIIFENVSKQFNVYTKQSDKLLEVFSLKKTKGNFFALRDVSFKIYEGEAIGIVGLNGSGKSTLSNLLAQVLPPTSGKMEINGETSLIAISVGLNNQLSGLENIELKCLMHGLKKEEIERLTPSIIEFADIGSFINQPVKNYSSGMKSRLGFAISIHTNPDILIVDEALSVGDQTFYEKCLVRINEFKSQGKTIIFISHSLPQIKTFCDRVIWVHFGKLEMIGDSEAVIKEYSDYIKWFNALTEDEKKSYRGKMLNSQHTKENSIDINPFSRQSQRTKRKQKKHKKGNSLFSLQVILLVLATIISASFIFGANPVQSIEKYINQTFIKETKHQIPNSKVSDTNERASEEVTKQEDMFDEINDSAIVSTGTSALYSEKELTTPVRNLTFSEKVFVIGQLRDIYKIRTQDNIIGFTNIEGVKVLDEELPIAQRNLTEFLPLFPNRFSNAYAYFLTFLNAESEEVTSTLIGSTDDLAENGDKLLTYPVYDAQYLVNKDNKAASIIINNIQIDGELWTDLQGSASLKSNDNQYYYFILEEYKVMIDTVNKKATISTVN